MEELRELRREIRWLRLITGACVAGVLLNCAGSVGTTAASDATQDPQTAASAIKELTVERINVREPDGTLRLVVSNAARAPGPIVDLSRGEEQTRASSAGIVFYNERGLENGAIFHDGKDVGISLDRFDQDQTLQLTYGESDAGYYSGMFVWDRPDHSLVETRRRIEEVRAIEDATAQQAAAAALQEAGEFGPPRMFVGRDESAKSVLELHDARGRPRLRLAVASDGQAKISFIDIDGKEQRVITPSAEE